MWNHDGVKAWLESPMNAEEYGNYQQRKVAPVTVSRGINERDSGREDCGHDPSYDVDDTGGEEIHGMGVVLLEVCDMCRGTNTALAAMFPQSDREYPR
jgi:hypothetical protein